MKNYSYKNEVLKRSAASVKAIAEQIESGDLRQLYTTLAVLSKRALKALKED